MPVFYQQVVGSVVRSALAAALGWLVFNGYITESVMNETLPALVGFVLVVSWSIWQKYQTRQGKLMGAALPSGTSEREVDAAVKAGEAPSVLASKDARVF